MANKEKTTTNPAVPVPVSVPEPSAVTAPQTAPTGDNSLAIVAMVLGLVSLTGPGLLFGIPAIILGAMALKRQQGERGLAITGLVTGIVSTVVSILFIGLVLFLIIWGANNPNAFPESSSPTRPSAEQMFDSSRT